MQLKLKWNHCILTRLKRFEKLSVTAHTLISDLLYVFFSSVTDVGSVWEDHWRRQRNSAVSQLPQQLPWRHELHVPLWKQLLLPCWLPGIATRVPLRHQLHCLRSGTCCQRILCQWLCGGGSGGVRWTSVISLCHLSVFESGFGYCFLFSSVRTLKAEHVTIGPLIVYLLTLVHTDSSWKL